METLLSQNCLFCNKKHNTWNELITCYKNNDLDKVNWHWISWGQKLSLKFIKEFQDKVDWNGISRYQKLSLEFIKEFQDKVDWIGISCNKYLTNDIILEFYNKLNSVILLNRIDKKELKVSQIVRNRLTLDRF